MQLFYQPNVIRGNNLKPAPRIPFEGDLEIKEYCTVEFPDYEKILATSIHPPLIANEIDTTTPEGQEQLKAILYKRYRDEEIDIKPVCGCGNLSGGSKLGLECPICKTQVTHPIQSTVTSSLWIKNLDGVHKFVATGWWVVFSNIFSVRDWNLLEYLVSPDVPEPHVNFRFYPIVKDLDLSLHQRNLNFFYEYFTTIMDRIATALIIRKKPRGVKGMTNVEIADAYKALKAGELTVYDVMLNTPIGDHLKVEKETIAFIHQFREKRNIVFTSYLPMVSSAAMVLEDNATGTYFDEVANHAVNALYAITNSTRTALKQTERYKNRKMVECIKNMAKFSSSFVRDRCMGKKRLIRSHMFGGRQPFTMRCVIGPLIDDTRHEELILPYAPSIQMFRTHILNKLKDMPRHPEFGAWTPRTCNNFIDNYTNTYHPLMESVLQELLDESLYGIGGLFNRPPSLEKGSIKLVFAVGISRDPREKLIRMSTDITNTFNADYDGDAMAFMLALDRRMMRIFEPLRSYRNVPSMAVPHQFSHATEEQAPQAITIHNYLYGRHDKYNTVQ